MSQGYRISQYDEIADIKQLMDQVRQAHEVESRVPAVEDRVERHRASYLPDAPAHRVDVHRQMTANLESGPFNPERIGSNRQVPGRRVVKAEARSADYQGLPPRAEARTQRARGDVDTGRVTPEAAGETPKAALPGWVATEQALERAIDYNEEVLVPAARHPVTKGAVASAQSSSASTAPAEASSSPATEPHDPDKTHGGFEYPEGGRYLADYAAGAEVVSGDGASYHDPNRTQTFAVPKKRV